MVEQKLEPLADFLDKNLKEKPINKDKLIQLQKRAEEAIKVLEKIENRGVKNE